MSVYWDILTAVQGVVASVIPNTVIRRKLQRLENDVMPMCYIVPKLPGGEKIGWQAFNKVVSYDYTVLVVYVQQGAADLQTGFQTFLANREAIRQLLFVPLLTGVSQVYDTDLEPDPQDYFGEFLNTNYDVAGWLMQYKTSENRSA